MGGGLSTARHSVVEGSPADFARVLLRAKHAVALTGAALSTKSGVPIFLDPKDPLWTQYSMDDYATAEAFRANPANIWKLIRDYIKNPPKPNSAHEVLAELEQLGILRCVITQNVDNLHQAGGSRNVIEVDGNLFRATCTQCYTSCPLTDLNLHKAKQLPPLCDQCEGIYKPDLSLVGESADSVYRQRAQQEVSACDLLLIIGVINPSTELPAVAKRNGVQVMELNADRSDVTNKMVDLVVLGDVQSCLSKVLHEVKRRLWHEFRVFAENLDHSEMQQDMGNALGEGGPSENTEGGAAGPNDHHLTRAASFNHMHLASGLTATLDSHTEEGVFGAALGHLQLRGVHSNINSARSSLWGFSHRSGMSAMGTNRSISSVGSFKEGVSFSTSQSQKDVGSRPESASDIGKAARPGSHSSITEPGKAISRQGSLVGTTAAGNGSRPGSMANMTGTGSRPTSLEKITEGGSKPALAKSGSMLAKSGSTLAKSASMRLRIGMKSGSTRQLKTRTTSVSGAGAAQSSDRSETSVSTQSTTSNPQKNAQSLEGGASTLELGLDPQKLNAKKSSVGAGLRIPSLASAENPFQPREGPQLLQAGVPPTAQSKEERSTGGIVRSISIRRNSRNAPAVRMEELAEMDEDEEH